MFVDAGKELIMMRNVKFVSNLNAINDQYQPGISAVSYHFISPHGLVITTQAGETSHHWDRKYLTGAVNSGHETRSRSARLLGSERSHDSALSLNQSEPSIVNLSANQRLSLLPMRGVNQNMIVLTEI